MITITAATGRYGRLVIDALLRRGVPASEIVAAVRDPEKAGALVAKGVQVREADYDRPETLAPAFLGADKLLAARRPAWGGSAITRGSGIARAWPRDVVGDTDRVTLGLDSSSALRSLPRYQELVRAIFLATDSMQEMPCTEWKREGDAKARKWRAELAKQVLGFANRDPEVASTWFGGCAYILVGVAPGVLNGSPVHDAAQIESWLAPYVGRVPNGPEWNGAYVEVDGKAVLVLSVEPPQVGHAAWPCRKEYLADPKAPGYDPTIALRDGAIYVRHKASTEEANSADIEMLNRRAAGSRRRIGGVSLLLGGESKAAALDTSPESIEAWAEREREALKPPPPPPPAPKTQTVRVSGLDPTSSIARTAKMLAELSESAISKSFATGLFEADARTPEDYQKEVDDYIGKAGKRLPAVVLWRAYERDLGRLALFVRNDTDDPIRQLQVEMYIAGEGFAAFDEGDIESASMPDRPVMLGKKVRSRFADISAINVAGLGLNRHDHYLPNIGPIGRGVRIDNSGSVRLTFDALDLTRRRPPISPRFDSSRTRRSPARRWQPNGASGRAMPAASCAVASTSRLPRRCRPSMSCSRSSGSRPTKTKTTRTDAALCGHQAHSSKHEGGGVRKAPTWRCQAGHSSEAARHRKALVEHVAEVGCAAR